MARKRSNPHETQARISLGLAIIGGLGALMLTVCVFWRFSFGDFAAYYREDSLRFYLILASFLLAMAASGIGFFVALNSAGQKRNNLSGLAWITFFTHAAILLIALCVFVVFYFAKEAVVMAG